MPWSGKSVVSSRVSGPALAVVRRDHLHSTPTSGAVLHSELVDAHTADDVDTVVVDGRVVVVAGRLLTGDKPAIRAEAESQPSALIARASLWLVGSYY